jgi:hypothetical protein
MVEDIARQTTKKSNEDTFMRKLFLTVLALLPAPVFAVDGVVLINQSALTAAGGTYTITQPGSYKLSGNLVAPAGKQAIVIAANSVTLDLSGFSVTCSLTQPTSNFSCIGNPFLTGVADVILQNGFVSISVAAASLGGTIVNFNDSVNVTIEGVHVRMNSPAQGGFVGLAVGTGSIIRHNIVPANGSFNGGLNTHCPSLVEGNVTGGILLFGSSCVAIANIGDITVF